MNNEGPYRKREDACKGCIERDNKLYGLRFWHRIFFNDLYHGDLRNIWSFLITTLILTAIVGTAAFFINMGAEYADAAERHDCWQACLVLRGDRYTFYDATDTCICRTPMSPEGYMVIKP